MLYASSSAQERFSRLVIVCWHLISWHALRDVRELNPPMQVTRTNRNASTALLRCVVFVAVLTAVCVAARVEASCGDYLRAPGVGHMASNQNEVRDSKTGVAGPGESQSGDQAGTPFAPCRGPNCSRQSKPFVPPPPLVISSAPLKAAVAAVVKHDNCLAGRSISEPEWLAIPIRHPIHIFRPPRAVWLPS